MSAGAADAERLSAAGMTEAAVVTNARAFAGARGAWSALASRDQAHALFVPGRIEVLGKHTDYAGGSTLTCAVERGACAVWSARPDEVLAVVDAASGERMECALRPDLEVPIGHWSNYPMTAAKRLARNFGRLRGVDLAFHSTLPSSAGLSSSSVLVTMTFLTLAARNALAAHPAYRSAVSRPADLAGYLGSVENGQAFGALAGDRGVGTFGGSEDHTAMLCSEPGRLGYFAFCPVRRLESVPVPAGYTFVVAASGIAATKTGNALERYNRASLLVRSILDRWQHETGRGDPTLAAALASSPDAADSLDRMLRAVPPGVAASADLLRRLDHFRLENDTILPGGVRALASGDLTTFGRLADESQDAAERLLGNQVPETILLARLARELGAAAASAFGAGFGGSVWALVETRRAPAFEAQWQDRYRQQAPSAAVRASVFFITAAGIPATELEPDIRRWQ